MTDSIFIRAATAADQPVITRMIRVAQLNPLGLHWPNFLIAQDGDGVAGIGQIKPHRDGSRELASIAVAPARQGQGIATALIIELLRRQQGETFLYCRDTLVNYYARFGYYRISGSQLPPNMRRLFRIPQGLNFVFRAVTGRHFDIAAMRRDA